MAQDLLIIKDVGGNANTYNVTVIDNGTGATLFTMNVNGQAIMLTPDGNTGSGTWRVVGKYL